ncbi:ATP-dependent helicase [Ruminococcus bromii]|jgi:SNF2 family DNA or RNA helicase|nr:DEAD/DEAH box helicase [Ruminococcus bromii]RGR25788.1 ATP-dependent helicase [Ruminococcus bromii]DAV84796.1 MAG TPA: Chromatin remodeling complex ATPase [Caudoviricetes sp.]
MKYKPHSYQEYAIRYIETHPISALLIDMGLGKTSITLTAIRNLLFDSFEVCKVLVIAPLRVAKNTWTDEIKKWEHLNTLTYSLIIGNENERLSALNEQTDIYIINRENVDWLVNKSGYKFDFDMVVIDELSSFKNHQSKRFKSLMKVRPLVKRIVGLTGTPSSNGLMDLFAEFKILDMGKRLGYFIGQYRNTYFKPDKMNGPIVYSYKPLPNAENAIYNKISDITVSMKANEYLKMPELLTSNYIVELSNSEKNQYDEMKKSLVLEITDGEITASNAASLSNKLCQLSNGAIYDDEQNIVEIHDRKLEALEDIIESMNGKPLLIAYWYRHDLERIKSRFSVREIKTSEDISDWNDGKISVALIHPASAGHGLNLQNGGSTLVWFGLTWSLELYQQTNARLYRQGQKNTVVIQHIITKGTIDEQILKALQKKNKTQADLIDAVRANLEV